MIVDALITLHETAYQISYQSAGRAASYLTPLWRGTCSYTLINDFDGLKTNINHTELTNMK